MSVDTTTIPLSGLAEVNPKVDLTGLRPNDLVSFIPMADLREGGGWRQRQSRTLKDVRSGFTPFAEGDVLFAKITPCMENGKGAHAQGLVNRVGFGTTELHVLRAKGSTDSRFLYHWLQTSRVRCRAVAFMGGSAGQQRVQADFFDHYRVPRLDPDSQIRAGWILDSIDGAIERVEAVIAKLAQVRAGLIRDLLTRGLDDNGQVRDVPECVISQNESVVGPAPRGWEIVPFGRYVTDWAVGPRFGGELYRANGNVATLRTTDMDDDGTLSLGTMPLAQLELAAFRKHLLQPRDLVVSRSGTCGIAGVFHGHSVPVLPGAFLLRFRFTRRVQPEYMRLYLNAPFTRRRIMRIAEGGVQKNIRGTSVLPMLVPLPPESEQAEVLNRVQLHDSRAAAEQSALATLRRVKVGLQADLLSGDVRVLEAQQAGANA